MYETFVFLSVVSGDNYSSQSGGDAVMDFHCFIHFCGKLIFTVARIQIQTRLGELDIFTCKLQIYLFVSVLLCIHAVICQISTIISTACHRGIDMPVTII